MSERIIASQRNLASGRIAIPQARVNASQREYAKFPYPYDAKALALGPIAYWPQNDFDLSACVDLAVGDGSLDGAYVGSPILAQKGIGDRSLSVLYNGSGLDNQNVNIYSAALNAVFNGQLFTIGTWFKPLNAGWWTDGLQHTLMRIYSGGSNRMYLQGGSANNAMRVFYRADDNFEIVDTGGQSETGWVHWMYSVSLVADELKVFKNGRQIGATVNGIGTWSGSLNASNCRLAAASGTLSEHQGHQAKSIIFDRALSDADALAVGTLI